MTAAYTDLLAHQREAFLLSSSAAVLQWDQETGMPAGAGAVRAEQLGLLARLVHERTTDPRVGTWLLACEADRELLADPDAAANVRGLRRDYDRAVRLPASLVAELAATESLAQRAWVDARQADDFAAFRPWLERLLALQQQKADCLRRPDQPRWDALADLYEPGMNARDLRQWFSALVPRLLTLQQRLRGSTRQPVPVLHGKPIPEQAQEALVRTVLDAMGFDWQRGRLDRSAHPFCIGTGGDVRLTTRVKPDDVLDTLGSTMHEGGHGLYEQGLEPRWLGTPRGEAVSLGIHESQSRLWENHVGRSRAFWQWAAPRLREQLGPPVTALDAETLFRAANVVTPGPIRIEADEATYDLHIVVRFELEQALLAGELPVADLPAQWNQRYRELLGVAVPDDRHGCLQDVHWSCGLFGYFPTYTLGNLYAAQFAQAAARDLGDLPALLRRGDFRPLREWLQHNVHRHGRALDPGALCLGATGSPLSTEPFLRYLEQKFTEVYQL